MNTQTHYSQDFYKWFIIESIEIILNLTNPYNIDKFNCIKTLGTAMELKMAPTYTTQTLANLEENLYEIIYIEYGNNIKGEFT